MKAVPVVESDAFEDEIQIGGFQGKAQLQSRVLSFSGKIWYYLIEQNSEYWLEFLIYNFCPYGTSPAGRQFSINDSISEF